MQVYPVVIAAAGLLVAADARQEKGAVPQQRQPSFGLASIDKDGVITIRSKVTKYRDEVRMGAGGQRFIKMVPYEDVALFRLDSKEVPVYMIAAKGTKKVDPNKLAELLKEEKHVLIAPAGEELDPFYAAVIKEGTLVIVPPKISRGP